MYYKQTIGKFGEHTVIKYLEQMGYIILYNNFRCRFGEIDIIAKDNEKNEIVFIEVKTRNNNKYGAPAEAVDRNKRRHIFKTAQYFLCINKLENEFVRLDVIEVYPNRNNEKCMINHIKQAFIKNF